MWAALVLVLPSSLAGCLSFEEPTPSPGPITPPPSVAPTPPPRDPDTLVVAVPGAPARLLPPAEDPASALLAAVLYDPLYRLDTALVPVPELADGPPAVSPDGMTWSVGLASDDLRFQDGSPLRASDVAFSLRLARSSACALGRDLCSSVSRHLESVDDPTAPDRLTFRLREPWQPFLAEVLGRLPIVSEAAVRAGTAAIRDASGDTDPATLDTQVARIYEATNADACLSEAPPFGCRLADHIPDLEAVLGSVGLTPPARSIWTDATGSFDAEAYAAELLDRVAALGVVLGGRELDGLAAALPLIDPTRRPLGSGPYRLGEPRADGGIALIANADHVGGPPGIPRIDLVVVPDPAVAVTLLQAGDVDWLPEVQPDQMEILSASDGIVVGVRPLSIERTIVFNTRSERVYTDARTRVAFALCLDRGRLVEQASGGGAVAVTTWGTGGTWAFPSRPPAPTDPVGAARLLDEAGWVVGSDGIRERDGRRLTSEIAVRASRADLFTFAGAASAALRACGIELVVRELDLTGDQLLRQLRWPNDFDTVLISRMLGVDPDADMEAYAGSHATSEENPTDANPGGYSTPATNDLIARARQAPTPEARAALYAELTAALDADPPAWPIWYDTAVAAVSDRIREGLDPVDPTRARYDWDIAAWSFRPRP